MTTSYVSPGSLPPRGFRRIAPAFVLFFLSPFVAEFLLGNISISAIGALIFLSPLYGGGAVVVREVTRRLGRGWATIILLALAYGLVEEGLSIQTLFNPSYLGLHLLAEANIPALGIGGWWTLFVLTLHTVWSISVPIAVTEALFASRREVPWLGNVGLAVASVLYLAGVVLIYRVTQRQESFSASGTQLLSVSIIIVAVIALAFRFAAKKSSENSRPIPNPWVTGATTFALSLAFMAAHRAIHGWALVAVYLVLYLIGAWVLLSWSRRSTWTPLHTLSAAGGALFTYACTAFPQEPVIGEKGPVDLVGNTLFALIALVLFYFAARAERNRRTQS